MLFCFVFIFMLFCVLVVVLFSFAIINTKQTCFVKGCCFIVCLFLALGFVYCSVRRLVSVVDTTVSSLQSVHTGISLK